MAIVCSYVLNGMETSILCCAGVGNFPAFSGQRSGRNNPTLANVTDIGPLPTGRYFIVSRQSGGRLGPIREFGLNNWYGTDRSTWFGLYRDDGKINDETFIAGVRRGNFRLHPIGPRALSEGCVTMTSHSDFEYLRAELLNTSMIGVPGTSLRAHGTIRVTLG